MVFKSLKQILMFSTHGGERMNQDRMNGTIDQVVGSAKRKAGQLTGNPTLQVKGMVQQVKGKVESVLGKAKDVVQEANESAASKTETHVKVKLECSATVPRRNKKM